MNQKIKKELMEIVGEENFTDSLIDLIAFSRDASQNQGRPQAALWVENTSQVSEVMKLAGQEKLPVIPRGAGTGLSGMAVPVQGGLVMDMSRMNRIKSISIEDRVAVVEPGVVYETLQNELSPHGFFFPPDPASGKVSTLGGNAATNAGGVKGAKYGTTKDYVLALEVVLPDGRVLKTGSGCMKCVSGYDLTKLFVGSEGTLGVITEITLKINPKPGQAATAMATFDDVEDAGRAVSQIMHSGILPSVLEVIDRHTLRAINENTDLNLPEVAAILLAETDGHTQAETSFQMAKVIDIFKDNNASLVKEAESEEEAEALWTARKSAYAVMARINNDLLVEDLTVPMSKVAEMLKLISDIAAKYDLKIPTVGHVGDGNLHPTISFDGTDEDQVAKVHQASEEIFKHVISLGGTLTGEHGIGLDKTPFMHLEHDQVAMGVMRSLKQLFDPHNILNPGKMALEA